MSDMPALDTLYEMSKDFEGKSEEEILDIISERTEKLQVDKYNNLPLYDGAFKEVGQIVRTKSDVKKEGDFVLVLEATTINLDDEAPTMEMRATMRLLVD